MDRAPGSSSGWRASAPLSRVTRASHGNANHRVSWPGGAERRPTAPPLHRPVAALTRFAWSSCAGNGERLLPPRVSLAHDYPLVTRGAERASPPSPRPIPQAPIFTLLTTSAGRTDALWAGRRAPRRGAPRCLGAEFPAAAGAVSVGGRTPGAGAEPLDHKEERLRAGVRIPPGARYVCYATTPSATPGTRGRAGRGSGSAAACCGGVGRPAAGISRPAGRFNCIAISELSREPIRSLWPWVGP